MIGMTGRVPSLGRLPGEGDTCVPDAPPTLDAARLTAAMSRGEAVAVETFYRAYFAELYAEARHVTRRDEAFCLDVVQDSVLRILRTVRPVASRQQLAAWLKLVVRTTAYDLLRSERRRRAREDSAAADRMEAPADVEQLVWLRTKLRAIDPRIAELIELRFTHRWTLSRIAGRFGLTTAAVDGRLRRALLSLRSKAREEFDE
jgi:RNA polymerase sigma factor (sigma-70 family)